MPEVRRGHRAGRSTPGRCTTCCACASTSSWSSRSAPTRRSTAATSSPAPSTGGRPTTPAPTSYLRLLAEPDGARRVGRVVTRAGRARAGPRRAADGPGRRRARPRLLVLDAQSYVQKFYAARGFEVSATSTSTTASRTCRCGASRPVVSPTAGSALPRSTPREQGVDAQGVEGFLDAVEAHPDVELHSLMVLRHGHVVAEGWWAPYSSERLHLLYSLSKSFTSAALGLAVAEGLVGLDDTVLQHLPHLGRRRRRPRPAGCGTWPRWRAATPGTPGTTSCPPTGRSPSARSCGWLRTASPARGSPTTSPAPTRSPRCCSRSPARRSPSTCGRGCSIPLGIGEVRWNQLPAGRDIGFSGLHARTEDIARLGLLHLQEGRWDDGQVLPGRVGPRGHHARRSPPPARTRSTGRRATASSSGAPGTATAATAPTASTASCCPSTTSSWPSPAPRPTCRPCSTRCGSTCCPRSATVPLDDAAAADAHRGAAGNPGAPGHGGRPSAGRLQDRWDQTSFSVNPRAPTSLPGSPWPRATSQRDGRWWLRLDEADEALEADLGTGGWGTVTEDASSAALVPVAASAGWQRGRHARGGARAARDPALGAAAPRPPRPGRPTSDWVTEPLHGSPLTRCAAPRY